jgi:hypothetical protein
VLWQSRASAIRSDGGKRPLSPRHFSSAEAKAIDLLEVLYPLTPGRFGGGGFLHDGSPNAQRADDYDVLFFIHWESRQEKLAGFTPYADQEWMEQQARNMTMEECCVCT